MVGKLDPEIDARKHVIETGAFPADAHRQMHVLDPHQLDRYPARVSAGGDIFHWSPPESYGARRLYEACGSGGRIV